MLVKKTITVLLIAFTCFCSQVLGAKERRIINMQEERFVDWNKTVKKEKFVDRRLEYRRLEWSKIVRSEIAPNKKNNEAYLEGRSLAVGSKQGDIYVGGEINGINRYNFGNGVRAVGNFNDISNPLLVKYNKAGVAQWAKSTITKDASSSFMCIALDADENIYVVGNAYGSDTAYDFGNEVKLTVGKSRSYHPILVKYNSNGYALWARSIVSENQELILNHMTVSKNGNIYVVGELKAHERYANFDSNFLLVKYDKDGVVQWAKSDEVSRDGGAIFTHIALDADENIYAVGSVAGNNTYDFGNQVVITGGSKSKSAVLIKYDHNGVPQWGRSVIRGGWSSFRSIAVDINNNIYVMGGVASDVYDFGRGVVIDTSTSNNNAFLIKYDSYGAPQWIQNKISGKGFSLPPFASSLAVDLEGGVYVVGEIINEFLSNTEASDWSRASILVKYNDEGNYQWHLVSKNFWFPFNYPSDKMFFEKSSVIDTDLFYCINVDPDKNIYLTGVIVKPLEFGSGRYFPEGSHHFLVKYREDRQSIYDQLEKARIREL